MKQLIIAMATLWMSPALAQMTCPADHPNMITDGGGSYCVDISRAAGVPPVTAPQLTGQALDDAVAANNAKHANDPVPAPLGTYYADKTYPHRHCSPGYEAECHARDHGTDGLRRTNSVTGGHIKVEMDKEKPQ